CVTAVDLITINTIIHSIAMIITIIIIIIIIVVAAAGCTFVYDWLLASALLCCFILFCLII
ncbi:MAG: hypothetical protein ACI90V_012259, partial [Bacillariaceae sp.]